MLASGFAGWFLLNSRNDVVEPIASEARARLDLRPYAIVRGEAPQQDRSALTMPRARAVLTLLLPTGSEPGPYEVEIRDSSAVSKASAKGDASLRNQVTTLDVAADLRRSHLVYTSSRFGAVASIGNCFQCRFSDVSSSMPFRGGKMGRLIVALCSCRSTGSLRAREARMRGCALAPRDLRSLIPPRVQLRPVPSR